MSDIPMQRFYDDQYVRGEYAAPSCASQHPYFPLVKQFVEDYRLASRRCLEIGCGRGAFQDLVADYTGLDISAKVSCFLHKPFVRADATALPFADNEFDAAWSVAVLEHVPRPELALQEVCRVVRPGGVVLMAPAWHTRPWFADGYPVRSYAELPWKGRLIKLSIPMRDFFLWRYTKILLRRSFRWVRYSAAAGPVGLNYVPLRPNYQKFWMSDSDACNSLAPFDVIWWFESRGHACLSHRRRRSQLLVRDLGLTFRIGKDSTGSRVTPGR